MRHQTARIVSQSDSATVAAAFTTCSAEPVVTVFGRQRRRAPIPGNSPVTEGDVSLALRGYPLLVTYEHRAR
jgi:hypothetical protein